MPLIPNHVTNYSIFRDGRRLIGLADVTLPNLANITDAVRGSGIFGEIDMPVQCHFQPASVTLNWHTVTDDGIFSSFQDKMSLDAWAAIQYDDTANNRIVHGGWRFVMQTAPKGFNLGTLGVGVKGAASTEFELIGIRCLLDDRIMLELHKENAVCKWWDGRQLVDWGARIRQLIGM
jgi:phage tail tube protein FII